MPAPRSIEALRWQARAELERRAREMATLSLEDFVPRLTPAFSAPRHLRRLTSEIERAIERAQRTDATDKPVRVVCSVPPRHQKTETLLHGIAYALRKRPELTVGYITYGASLAESKSARARLMATGASVELSPDMRKRSEWRTKRGGGGLLATGIGGALTGHGLDIAFVDDPFKNRIEAESPTRRQNVHDFLHDVVLSRLSPGASVIVTHARWHPDDLIGRLIGEGYTPINFPAIDEQGRALLPDRYPADCELFKEQQKVPYTWESLYLGRPRPRGAKVFVDVHVYEKLPDSGWKIGIGVDFAYSEKTRADYSVAVVVARHRDDKGVDRYYVLEVLREQVKSEVFESHLKALSRRYPLARLLFKGSSIECEIAKRMKSDGLKRLMFDTVHGDKLVRSERAQLIWNSGRLLVPFEEEEEDAAGNPVPAYSVTNVWVPEYTEEMNAFTGVKDVHDDCIDATANAIEACDGAAVSAPIDAQRLLNIGLSRRE